jgi:hypothetical protein
MVVARMACHAPYKTRLIGRLAHEGALDGNVGRPAIWQKVMRKSNFALRLQPSLLEEARRAAEAEGVALNQLINVAIAEKVSALRTERYFAERAARANIPKALSILKRSGVGNPPTRGDKFGRRKKRS